MPENNAEGSALATVTAMARSLEPQVILRAAALCDGRSILCPQAFADAGLPPAVVEFLTRVYPSDGSPTGTIHVNGRPIKELRGIHGLNALRFLASALGVASLPTLRPGLQCRHLQAGDLEDRSLQARQLQAMIRRHFGPSDDGPAAA